MKRLILCLVLVFGFFLFNHLVAQEDQLFLGSITNVPASVTFAQGAVVALGVNISDPSWTPSYVIKYAAGQTWYMDISVVNLSSSTQSFKIEFDLRYGDGVGYNVFRVSYSTAGGTYSRHRVNVTSHVAKLGLLTLTGRVYGTGMGNDNKVTGQVFVH